MQPTGLNLDLRDRPSANLSIVRQEHLGGRQAVPPVLTTQRVPSRSPVRTGLQIRLSGAACSERVSGEQAPCLHVTSTVALWQREGLYGRKPQAAGANVASTGSRVGIRPSLCLLLHGAANQPTQTRNRDGAGLATTVAASSRLVASCCVGSSPTGPTFLPSCTERGAECMTATTRQQHRTHKRSLIRIPYPNLSLFMRSCVLTHALASKRLASTCPHCNLPPRSCPGCGKCCCGCVCGGDE